MTARFLLSVAVVVGLCAVVLSFEGTATFYLPGWGACGNVSAEDEMVMAVSKTQYGEHQSPNKAPVCSQCTLVKDVDSGEQVKVKVVDRCEGCASSDILLSPAAFESLAPEDLGRTHVTWNYVEC
ncbi:papain inhibitor-like [Paramacrobiotus metropolitanus]|uniref:papain inhibitor-like n=1 Tax=Paramacrobiotus metropolitanus TaxID=2943436 RepID=UPI002445A537|nr:papain inhibitor-like [Paramacrobiotus metropolitanus]